MTSAIRVHLDLLIGLDIFTASWNNILKFLDCINTQTEKKEPKIKSISTNTILEQLEEI